jgi:diguanylate cyclase (GGDEF)-like protein
MIFYCVGGKLKPKNFAFIGAAVLCPIVLNMIYVFGLIPQDPTALGYLVSVICFQLLFRSDFFAYIPLTHRTIIEEMDTGFILLDAKKQIMEMNHAAKRLLNVEKENDFSLAKKIIDEDWQIFEKERISGLYSFVDSSLIEHQYRLSINTIHTMKRVASYALFIQDETALQKANERMEYLEKHDDTTGLFNRQHFMSLLEQEIESIKTYNHTIALVCVYVSNYNDCCYFYGNDFGNMMVSNIGRILRDSVRGDDILGRFSPNEIYIAMRFENGLALRERAAAAMERILDCFSSPFEIDGSTWSAKLNIGLAFAPQHAETADKLLSLACIARKKVSRNVKSPYNIYHDMTGESFERNITIEHDLPDAIKNGQIYLMYQPQVDTKSGKVVGVEALARWQHPSLGTVVPMDFIPIAEESGIINMLGCFVLKEGLKQLKAWQEKGVSSSLRLSVNVSLSQLADEFFADTVLSILAESGVEPACLELEITESLALFPEALRHGHLQKLRRKGVRIAMDDFGMGHSSLSYIKEFELDTVKIDRALISDIPFNQTAVAMVRTVGNLCKALGLTTIAEYVEKPEQYEILKELECSAIQGYLFSPPLLPDVCLQYILTTGTKA